MPQTDAFLQQNSVAHDDLWVAFAEKLERENEKLLKDNTRLRKRMEWYEHRLGAQAGNG
jgi:hypothetical protein